MSEDRDDDVLDQRLFIELLKLLRSESALCVSLVSNFSGRLDCIEQQLKRIERQGEQIMADQQLELDALKKIDDATTAIATNVTTQAGVVSTIASEVADLVAAQQAEGVPQPIIDQTSALADRLKAAADALNNQTPALQAIATAGASNPVPVPVPTPAPTT